MNLSSSNSHTGNNHTTARLKERFVWGDWSCIAVLLYGFYSNDESMNQHQEIFLEPLLEEHS